MQPIPADELPIQTPDRERQVREDEGPAPDGDGYRPAGPRSLDHDDDGVLQAASCD